MLDWLSSKVAMSLAALLLLAGVVGFFLAQRDRAVHDALQDIADRAAAYIDTLSESAGELATSISVGSAMDPGAVAGMELPALAAGEPYSLTLYHAYIVAGTDGDRAFAVLRTPIHFFEPEARPFTSEEVADLDVVHPSAILGHGGFAVLSRRYITVDGTARLGTFVL